jgi:hypothetical protein
MKTLLMRCGTKFNKASAAPGKAPAVDRPISAQTINGCTLHAEHDISAPLRACVAALRSPRIMLQINTLGS